MQLLKKILSRFPGFDASDFSPVIAAKLTDVNEVSNLFDELLMSESSFSTSSDISTSTAVEITTSSISATSSYMSSSSSYQEEAKSSSQLLTEPLSSSVMHSVSSISSETLTSSSSSYSESIPTLTSLTSSSEIISPFSSSEPLPNSSFTPPLPLDHISISSSKYYSSESSTLLSSSVSMYSSSQISTSSSYSPSSTLPSSSESMYSSSQESTSLSYLSSSSTSLSSSESMYSTSQEPTSSSSLLIDGMPLYPKHLSSTAVEGSFESDIYEMPETLIMETESSTTSTSMLSSSFKPIAAVTDLEVFTSSSLSQEIVTNVEAPSVSMTKADETTPHVPVFPPSSSSSFTYIESSKVTTASTYGSAPDYDSEENIYDGYTTYTIETDMDTITEKPVLDKVIPDDTDGDEEDSFEEGNESNQAVSKEATKDDGG